MKIKRLTATFGRLENETLRLEPGLNIIEAPNERGKSTWTAFLRVMLYGLNTRDPQRQTPTSGGTCPGAAAPCRAFLEADTCLGDVTITRSTVRANAPMGAFSAVRTGPRSLWRVSPPPAAGRPCWGCRWRYTSAAPTSGSPGWPWTRTQPWSGGSPPLITTGEEDTSYTDARRPAPPPAHPPPLQQDRASASAERELEELERDGGGGRTLEESCYAGGRRSWRPPRPRTPL